MFGVRGCVCVLLLVTTFSVLVTGLTIPLPPTEDMFGALATLIDNETEAFVSLEEGTYGGCQTSLTLPNGFSLTLSNASPGAAIITSTCNPALSLVSCVNCSVSFENLTFFNFTTTRGILANSGSMSSTTVSSCVVSNIKGTTTLRVFELAGTVTVQNSHFETYSGNNLYVTSGDVMIAGSSFSLAATTGGSAVIVSSSTSVTVVDSVFRDNSVSSTTPYGALLIQQCGSVSLLNSTFSSNSANHASSDGGAVYVSYSRVLIESSIFEDNFSKEFGAGVALFYNMETVVQNSFFARNACGGSSSGRGGGIYSRSTYRNIFQNLTFVDHWVRAKGGAMYLYGNSKDYDAYEVSNIRFLNSTAEVQGAALMMFGVGSYNYTTNVTNLYFDGYRIGTASVYESGIDLQDGQEFHMENITMKNGVGCTAILVWFMAYVAIDNLSVVDSYSTVPNCGPVAIWVSNTTVSGLFASNITCVGSVDWYRALYPLIGSGNTAMINVLENALFIDSNVTQSHLLSCSSCEALTLRNVTVRDSVAGTSGSWFASQTGPTVVMEDVTFLNIGVGSSAVSSGTTGILLSGQAFLARVSAVGCASGGPMLSSAPATFINASELTLVGNSESGDLVVLSSVEAVVTSSLVSQSTGAGILVEFSTVSLVDVTVADNAKGGLVQSSAGSTHLTLLRCHVEGNERYAMVFLDAEVTLVSTLVWSRPSAILTVLGSLNLTKSLVHSEIGGAIVGSTTVTAIDSSLLGTTTLSALASGSSLTRSFVGATTNQTIGLSCASTLSVTDSMVCGGGSLGTLAGLTESLACDLAGNFPPSLLGMSESNGAGSVEGGAGGAGGGGGGGAGAGACLDACLASGVCVHSVDGAYVQAQGCPLCEGACWNNQSDCAASISRCWDLPDHEWSCSCRTGYEGNGVLCDDVDECVLAANTSQTLCQGERELCLNTLGSFECVCMAGFVMENGLCVDVDECGSSLTHNCAQGSATCTDTFGSFTCSCSPNFFGSGVECSPCPPHSNSSGGASLASDCQCASGFFPSLNGTCEECPPGFYVDGPSSCLPCELNTYSNTTNAAECVDCPPSSSTMGNAAATSCTCDLYFRPLTSSSGGSVTACMDDCPPGSSLALGFCSPCPKGSYASMINAPFCTECPLGATTEVRGTSSVTNCSCVEGKIWNWAGACQADCPPGTVYFASDDFCAPCPADTYSVAANSSACEQCPLFSGTNSSTGCSSPSACECLDGYEQSPYGNCRVRCQPGSRFVSDSQCEICGSNSFSTTVNAPRCTACPPHMVSSSNSTSVTACACAPGFYLPHRQQSSTTAAPPSDDGYDGGDHEGCRPCPHGAFCAGGESGPVALTGFSEKQGSEAVFVQCLPAEACAGAELCESGYIGPLCAWCREGYHRVNGYCRPCRPGNAALVVFVALGIVGACAVMIYLASRESASSRFTAAFIGLNTLQIVGQVGQLEIGWPLASQRLFDTVSVAQLNVEVLGLECKVAAAKASDVGVVATTASSVDGLVSPFVGRWVLTMVLPLILLGGLALAAAVYLLVWKVSGWALRKKEDYATFLKGAVARAFVHAVMVMYLPLASAVFDVFDCVDNGLGVRVVRSSRDQECFSSPRYWRAYGFGWFFLFAYVIGIPLATSTLLFFYKRRMAEVDFYRAFGAVVGRYKSEYFMYECVVMVRKLLVALTLSFLSNSPFLNAGSAAAVLALFFVLNCVVHPYGLPKHGWTESVCLMSAIAVLEAASIFNDPLWTPPWMNFVIITLVVVTLVVVALGVAYDVLSEADVGASADLTMSFVAGGGTGGAPPRADAAALFTLARSGPPKPDAGYGAGFRGEGDLMTVRGGSSVDCDEGDELKTTRSPSDNRTSARVSRTVPPSFAGGGERGGAAPMDSLTSLGSVHDGGAGGGRDNDLGRPSKSSRWSSAAPLPSELDSVAGRGGPMDSLRSMSAGAKAFASLTSPLSATMVASGAETVDGDTCAASNSQGSFRDSGGGGAGGGGEGGRSVGEQGFDGLVSSRAASTKGHVESSGESGGGAALSSSQLSASQMGVKKMDPASRGDLPRKPSFAVGSSLMSKNNNRLSMVAAATSVGGGPGQGEGVGVAAGESAISAQNASSPVASQRALLERGKARRHLTMASAPPSPSETGGSGEAEDRSGAEGMASPSPPSPPLPARGRARINSAMT